jgi:DNA topoisomerase IB
MSWISPSRAGHIQATGRDAKRRTQYRYHERWRESGMKRSTAGWPTYLFRYLDDDGVLRPIESEDVNQFSSHESAVATLIARAVRRSARRAA